MKKLLVILVSVFYFLPGCSSAQNLSPEQQFKKTYSTHKYETFAPTSIKGVYEVYNGQQIYYYLPEGDVIFLGNIISKDGQNLTQESNAKKMESKLAKLPLDKALKIGNGKKKVVKFTDPNCPYCRRAFEFFDKRKDDVTLYVFFLPLSQDSANKIQHIFCANDKTKAYDDVLGGKLDGNAQLNLCKDKNVEELIKANGEASAKIGVRSTPLFYIKGKVVSGFDQPAIEKLLTE